MQDSSRGRWLPRLRQLIENVINHCYGCKIFHGTKFLNPPKAELPLVRKDHVPSRPWEQILQSLECTRSRSQRIPTARPQLDKSCAFKGTYEPKNTAGIIK